MSDGRDGPSVKDMAVRARSLVPREEVTRDDGGIHTIAIHAPSTDKLPR